MKFYEYRELTKRTLPDLSNSLLNNLANSIHMVLGMCSEIEELYEAIEKFDIVNISEELIDGAWYAANYCNIHDINPGYVPYTPEDLELESFDKELLLKAVKDLIIVISKLQDLDKKLLAYNKHVEHSERKELIEEYFVILHAACQFAGIDVELGMQNNIDKLSVRFPDKFTQYLANNRNLVAERKELEK